MSPDELVSAIFKLQEEADPDSDPGDIDISIQDDSALTVVIQNSRVIGVGGSIQNALENALSRINGDAL